MTESDTFDPASKTFTVTLGDSKTCKVWKIRKGLTWDELALRLSESPIGPKDGPCYTPAHLTGTKRQLPFVERIDIAVLDSDCGHTLEEIRAVILAAGFAAIVHSTHSHMSDTTEVVLKALDEKHGGDAVAALRAKGYLPRVLEGGARVIGQTMADKKECAVIQHGPCPKFRIIIPLLNPWLGTTNYKTRAEAQNAWRDFIRGLAVQLGLHSDQSCCDPTRLFFFPRSRRGGPAFEFLRIRGAPVDLGAVKGAGRASAKRDRGKKTPRGSDEPPEAGTPTPDAESEWRQSETPEGPDQRLVQWAAEYGYRFELVTALAARSPGKLGRLNGVKQTIECPFEDEHSSPGGEGTFAVNASRFADAELPERASGFYAHCSHDACAGRERLDFVDGMLANGWLTEADLTDPAFLGPEDPARESKSKSPFTMERRGLIWRDPDEKEPDVYVSGPFEVLAKTRAALGLDWGLLIRWSDDDGRAHEWVIPRSMLSGDGREVRTHLMGAGLYIAPGMKARSLFNTYLCNARTARRARSVATTGWHGSAFVLPDTVIGDAGPERVVLQTDKPMDHAFDIRGTLDEWKDNVGRYAVGNSRIALSVSMAFAAALVGPCGEESGGIHLWNKSSVGKTTSVKVGGSVWGGGDHGYYRTWRATANGLEGVAACHNDTLLVLDELSQVTPHEAGACAYMLANEQGKSRADRSAFLRKSFHWKLIFLSSGEITLADKMAEDARGPKQTAGQQVRMVDVPAFVGEHGAFENLHGFGDGEEFSKHLQAASYKFYGAPIRAFLASIAPDLGNVATEAKSAVKSFVKANCPAGAAYIRRASSPIAGAKGKAQQERSQASGRPAIEPAVLE